MRVVEDDGKSTQFVVFFKDLTEKLAANKRIEELAYNDALTGLPNRVLLGERIELVSTIASDIWSVHVDRAQIEDRKSVV